MPKNIIKEGPVKVVGKGSFTPPPAPCGGADCQYVEFDVVHSPECQER